MLQFLGAMRSGKRRKYASERKRKEYKGLWNFSRVSCVVRKGCVGWDARDDVGPVALARDMRLLAFPESNHEHACWAVRAMSK